MDDGELIRWRLASHRLTGQGFAPTSDGAADVVRWLGAVQSQDHEPALWSLAQRSDGVALDALGPAFDAGAFLRTHVLRPTWHFVPPERLRPLLALTGPRVAAACAGRWRELDLPADVRARSADVMAAAIAERGQLTRPELKAVLEAAGIPTEGQRTPHLLLHAELAAVLCSGGLKGRQQTWALVDDRVPPASPFDRDAELCSLAAAYVRSHGPATERDFAWWSGLSLGDVRRGLELAEPDVDVLEAGGRRYWFSGPPPERGPGGPCVHLVQSYDEYLVGYGESRALVDPAGFAVHMPRGALLGTAVLVDGLVAGRWRRSVAAGRAGVDVTCFTPLAPAALGALEGEARRYADFLGLPLRLRVGGAPP